VPVNISALRALLTIFLAALPLTANGACLLSDPAAYEQIDRIVLVRCAPTTAAHPCFRIRVRIQNGTTTKALNAVMGVGLRGQYVNNSADRDEVQSLQGMLHDAKVFSLVLPAPERVIDGSMAVLLVRACGQMRELRSHGGDGLPEYATWNALLDELQAYLLNPPWTQTAQKPNMRELTIWADQERVQELLNLEAAP
jgi:hypothetical protein